MDTIMDFILHPRIEPPINIIMAAELPFTLWDCMIDVFGEDLLTFLGITLLLAFGCRLSNDITWRRIGRLAEIEALCVVFGWVVVPSFNAAHEFYTHFGLYRLFDYLDSTSRFCDDHRIAERFIIPLFFLARLFATPLSTWANVECRRLKFLARYFAAWAISAGANILVVYSWNVVRCPWWRSPNGDITAGLALGAPEPLPAPTRDPFLASGARYNQPPSIDVDYLPVSVQRAVSTLRRLKQNVSSRPPNSKSRIRSLPKLERVSDQEQRTSKVVNHEPDTTNDVSVLPSTPQQNWFDLESSRPYAWEVPGYREERRLTRSRAWGRRAVRYTLMPDDVFSNPTPTSTICAPDPAPAPVITAPPPTPPHPPTPPPPPAPPVLPPVTSIPIPPPPPPTSAQALPPPVAPQTLSFSPITSVEPVPALRPALTGPTAAGGPSLTTKVVRFAEPESVGLVQQPAGPLVASGFVFAPVLASAPVLVPPPALVPVISNLPLTSPALAPLSHRADPLREPYAYAEAEMDLGANWDPKWPSRDAGMVDGLLAIFSRFTISGPPVYSAPPAPVPGDDSMDFEMAEREDSEMSDTWPEESIAPVQAPVDQEVTMDESPAFEAVAQQSVVSNRMATQTPSFGNDVATGDAMSDVEMSETSEAQEYSQLQTYAGVPAQPSAPVSGQSSFTFAVSAGLPSSHQGGSSFSPATTPATPTAPPTWSGNGHSQSSHVTRTSGPVGGALPVQSTGVNPPRRRGLQSSPAVRAPVPRPSTANRTQDFSIARVPKVDTPAGAPVRSSFGAPLDATTPSQRRAEEEYTANGKLMRAQRARGPSAERETAEFEKMPDDIREKADRATAQASQATPSNPVVRNVAPSVQAGAMSTAGPSVMAGPSQQPPQQPNAPAPLSNKRQRAPLMLLKKLHAEHVWKEHMVATEDHKILLQLKETKTKNRWPEAVDIMGQWIEASGRFLDSLHRHSEEQEFTASELRSILLAPNIQDHLKCIHLRIEQIMEACVWVDWTDNMEALDREGTLGGTGFVKPFEKHVKRSFKQIEALKELYGEQTPRTEDVTKFFNIYRDAANTVLGQQAGRSWLQ